MKKIYSLLLFSCFLSGCYNNSVQIKDIKSSGTKYTFKIYNDIPKPFEPEDNPITNEKVKLGKYLFYDKRLSANNTFSCATCHEQSRAFSDGKTVAEGVFSQKHSKNSMGLTNVGYNTVLTWGNPNMFKLETQMLIPIFGDNPHEMGMAGKEDELIQRIKSENIYHDLFNQAFPEQKENINLENITKAIASFERVLVSFNSPYDKYEFGNDKNAISESAKKGKELFFGEKFECSHCHSGYNFSDSTRDKKSQFSEFNFHNNGLYNIDNKDDYPVDGRGIAEITLKKEDIGKFRAPTLRNIEVTAPYMHDGSIATLEEVIEHYSKGGRIIKEGVYKGDGTINKNKSGFVRGFNMSEEEKQNMLDFLKSLTDKTFLENPEYSDPWNK